AFAHILGSFHCCCCLRQGSVRLLGSQARSPQADPRMRGLRGPRGPVKAGARVALGGTSRLKTAALIVAAGRGRRAGGPPPKQYVAVGGVPVLARALGAFLAHPDIALAAAGLREGGRARDRSAGSGPWRVQTA